MADQGPIDQAAADVSPAAVDRLWPIVEVVYGPDSAGTICRYRDMLASRGIDWGLLGPREVNRLWDRHILNSASVAQLLEASGAVADVGSGAGLPGIPVAVLRPHLSIDLVEPMLRRSNFLSLAVDELRLGHRVAVVRARAEALQRTYDAVLSRALAPLDRLVGWCLPLMKPSGQILAIKGASAGDEVEQHERLLSRVGLRAEVLDVTCDPRVQPTTVVRLQRR